MINVDVSDIKTLGQNILYSDRIGTKHLVLDTDRDGKPIRWAGLLIGVLGPNLLFEKRNGIRILVDPATVTRIIELPARRQ
jgi:hypothetical protein